MARKYTKETVCSVDYAFKRIGGKYKGRILWYLNSKRVLRYGELRKSIADITPKMLTQTLKELEADNLIRREVFNEIPPHVEYTLTADGLDLIPIIDQLSAWGDRQLAKGNVAPSLKVLACQQKEMPA
jgi:DNA-binding HxlR family transcriptional regulator